MIDRVARNDHAQKLRWLASGRISNDQYEDSLPISDDEATDSIFWNGGWHLYSDTTEHRLTGNKALDKFTKKDVARWVLFLKSDLPYRWPSSGPIVFLKNCMFFLTLGFAFRKFRQKRQRVLQQGHGPAWPFFSQEEVNAALSRPVFLRGIEED
jgi:hypothetical protein